MVEIKLWRHFSFWGLLSRLLPALPLSFGEDDPEEERSFWRTNQYFIELHGELSFVFVSFVLFFVGVAIIVIFLSLHSLLLLFNLGCVNQVKSALLLEKKKDDLASVYEAKKQKSLPASNLSSKADSFTRKLEGGQSAIFERDKKTKNLSL